MRLGQRAQQTEEKPCLTLKLVTGGNSPKAGVLTNFLNDRFPVKSWPQHCGQDKLQGHQL